MFVELHIIQNFPPSNLNRDDLGQPKDADFGGYRRARISSQCLKRSTRYAGRNSKTNAKPVFLKYTGVPLSVRTQLVASEIAKRLNEDYDKPKSAAETIARWFAEAYAGDMKDANPNETSVLLYLSESEIIWAAAHLADAWDTLVVAMATETPVQVLAKSFVHSLAQRVQQPSKADKVVSARDLGKEIQQRLNKRIGSAKDVDAVSKEFGKAFKELKSEAKTFLPEEVDWIADHIAAEWQSIQTSTHAVSLVKEIVSQFTKITTGYTSAPDIALFGRMLAGKPLNIDAACQVAHAISTNSIAGRTPIDYYTAVDDLKTDPGAGFLDVAYFNSACFYRYARLDYAQLQANISATNLQGEDLSELPLRTVEAFLRASEAAIPAGKKNAFAPECRPSFMLAVVRSSESDGWSLVNAFQKPVDPRMELDGDLVAGSVRRLEKHFGHLVEFYGNETIQAIAVALPDGVVDQKQLGDRFSVNVKNMQAWVKTITDALHSGG